MKTTSAVLEILVIGVQTAIWLVLAVLLTFDVDWVPATIKAVAGWETLIGVALLIVCYSAGIAMDRIVDCCFLRIGWRWPQFIESLSDRDTSADRSMVKILSHYERIVDYLEYIRSQLRVARAATVNCPLIFFFAAGLMYFRWEIHFGYAILSVIVGIAILFVTLFVFGILDCNHIRFLKQAENEMKSANEATDAKGGPATI